MGSGKPVSDCRAAFIQNVQRILARYAHQQERSPWADAVTAQIGERLWALLLARGLPPPLAPADMGSPGEMPPEAVAPLVAQILAGLAESDSLAKPVQQLVKACFYPEFRKCRDSFRELDSAGVCRRQQWSRAQARISGSHCVDCPYWLSLGPEQHARFLAQAWVGDPAEWAAHRDGFLPEDFRELRSTVRKLAAARVR